MLVRICEEAQPPEFVLLLFIEKYPVEDTLEP